MLNAKSAKELTAFNTSEDKALSDAIQVAIDLGTYNITTTISNASLFNSLILAGYKLSPKSYIGPAQPVIIDWS